jgi:hypothetical protein
MGMRIQEKGNRPKLTKQILVDFQPFKKAYEGTYVTVGMFFGILPHVKYIFM